MDMTAQPGSGSNPKQLLASGGAASWKDLVDSQLLPNLERSGAKIKKPATLTL